MKLTKSKLKQIIREELQEIHSPQQAWSAGEEPPPMPSTGEEAPGKPTGKSVSYQLEGSEGEIVDITAGSHAIRTKTIGSKIHPLSTSVPGPIDLFKVIREWVNTEYRK